MTKSNIQKNLLYLRCPECLERQKRHGDRNRKSSDHISITHRKSREVEHGAAYMSSKPTSSDILPSARRYLLKEKNLPKQHH